jgi:ABC-type multidrug transport system ATPase subunit
LSVSTSEYVDFKALIDRILVLDHGKVVEFDTPWNLLQKDDGVFRSLCKQSGEEATLLEVRVT